MASVSLRFPSAPVLALAFGGGLLLASCGGTGTTPLPPAAIPAGYVDEPGGDLYTKVDTLRNRFPLLRMEDGTLTINGRCPVRKVSLNWRMPALFVNGRPIGFC